MQTLSSRVERDSDNFSRQMELLSACIEGEGDSQQMDRLRVAIEEDPSVLLAYVEEMRIHALLEWRYSGRMAGVSDGELLERSCSRLDKQSEGSGVDMESSGLAIPLPGVDIGIPSFDSSGSSSPYSGRVGGFRSEWPLAYLIATLIFVIGLVIGAVTYVSHPDQVVGRQEVSSLSAGRSLSATAGRVSAMYRCCWSQDAHPLFVGDAIPLGRTIKIESGLLEISYNTGAKVILHGPVTYDVESQNGGFLSVGKLTGKVELESAKGFVVRTPNAIVTDLGTEFGVEVLHTGETNLHVFRGSVGVESAVKDGKAGEAGTAGCVLGENGSLKVVRQEGRWQIVTLRGFDASHFVREIPGRDIRVFDLVDVVAGGNGFSGRRGRGIDATNGKIMDTGPADAYHVVAGDGKYHRVEGVPFVDGVFIPDGSQGPVQTDSAGHSFEFPPTNNLTGHYVWAGGPIPLPPARSDIVVPTRLNDVDYAAPGHGLLFMHANKGITFDLEAIRRANPGYKIVAFRAVAGNVENEPDENKKRLADVWVLVDGQVRFRRREINHYTGGLTVAFAIRENDRFLTLVATDGGNGHQGDWTVFGDPRLELVPVEIEPVSQGKKQRKEVKH